jgi:DNA-directed RNA polymerase sigma subunit (sigma70/sigma32)
MTTYTRAETPDWFYRIDGESKISFTEKNKPGYFQEMKQWEAEGNEIGPLYSDEELAQQEAEASQKALDDHNQALIDLIRDNEYHLISRRFVADREQWEIALDKWAEQLEANKITEIYPKPF